MQRKWLLSLGLLLLVAVVIIVFTWDDDSDTTPITGPSEVTFKTGDKFELQVSETSYFDITNSADQAPKYLEFKPAQSGEGTLSIVRCEKDFDRGECNTGLTVLPPIDVAGWQDYLAAAHTDLNSLETGHYKVEFASKSSKNLTLIVHARK